MKKPAYTKDFMKFWFVYPRVWNSGKHRWIREEKSNAFVVWEYMTAEDKAHAMYAVQFEVQDKFQVHAPRWLAERRYDDVDMPEEEGEHLPTEMKNTLRDVPSGAVNVNNRRNKQTKELMK